MADQPIDAGDLARLLSARRTAGQTLIAALTGAVAAGKSTLAEATLQHLAAGGLKAELVCTDGFLFPNAVLEARGIALRKGFPESYDTAAMAVALVGVRGGSASFPGYSHTTYDIDPALARTVERPDILLIEGLGFPPGLGGGRLVDCLIYLDAEEADLEEWFVARFMQFWREAEHDPASFYVRFRAMSEPQAELFGRQVWAGINLPNLRENIIQARDHADIVIRKAAGHGLTLVKGA